MYFKGANVLHTIRQLVDDDAKWRAILRGLTRTFRHRTVTGRRDRGLHRRRVRSRLAGSSPSTSRPPGCRCSTTGWRRARSRTAGREVVAGFAMPVRVQIPGIGDALAPADGGVAAPDGAVAGGRRGDGGRELLRHRAQSGGAAGGQYGRRYRSSSPALTTQATHGTACVATPAFRRPPVVSTAASAAQFRRRSGSHLIKGIR